MALSLSRVLRRCKLGMESPAFFAMAGHLTVRAKLPWRSVYTCGLSACSRLVKKADGVCVCSERRAPSSNSRPRGDRHVGTTSECCRDTTTPPQDRLFHRAVLRRFCNPTFDLHASLTWPTPATRPRALHPKASMPLSLPLHFSKIRHPTSIQTGSFLLKTVLPIHLLLHRTNIS